MSEVTKVAMIGAGAMGGAIVEGLVTMDGVAVTVVEADDQRAAGWRARGDVEVADLLTAVANADVVFLAVKPHQVIETLRTFRESLGAGSVVVSIAAGITVDAMQRELPVGTSVIRTMPNTPVRVGRGVVGLAAGSHCGAEQVDRVRELLESVAMVVPIDEELIDALTATSGSGPAYVFYLAEAMKRGAEELGLPANVASAIIAQTFVGAAELLAAEPDKAVELRASVTSKGGTTAAATAVFDAADLPGIVAQAMRANQDRARELAEESG